MAVVRMELDAGHVDGARYVDVTIDDSIVDSREIQLAATTALVALRTAGEVAPWRRAGPDAVDGVPWTEHLAALRAAAKKEG